MFNLSILDKLEGELSKRLVIFPSFWVHIPHSNEEDYKSVTSSFLEYLHVS